MPSTNIGKGLVAVTGERSRLEETRVLADAMFDRHIDAASLKRLETLITSDLACLQVYVERIAFHGDLMKQSTERSAERQAEVAMGRILTRQSARRRRQVWGVRLAIVACLLVFGVGIERLIHLRTALSPKVGTISNLTADVRASSSSVELGEIIRVGKTFSIQEGIVSLQLPNVSVDLIGPVTVRMSGQSQLQLIRGAVHAIVRPGGEGFTVRTPGSVIVDLGTEFSVEYQPETGTSVNVLRGRVQASLLNSVGAAIKAMDLTTRRSAVFDEQKQIVREVNFAPDRFEEVIRAKGSIRTIDGALRTASTPPVSLRAEHLITTNHMLVIPEQQHVLLAEELQVTGINGPVRLPAGTRLASYLVHYDPDEWTTFAPRGAVTFDGKIAAVLVDGKELLKTDNAFGLPGTEYEPGEFRELELDEDEIQISDDLKTISFYFGVSGGKSLDQARILVVRDE
jgi:hypothetical protein